MVSQASYRFVFILRFAEGEAYIAFSAQQYLQHKWIHTYWTIRCSRRSKYTGNKTNTWRREGHTERTKEDKRWKTVKAARSLKKKEHDPKIPALSLEAVSVCLGALIRRRGCRVRASDPGDSFHFVVTNRRVPADLPRHHRSSADMPPQPWARTGPTDGSRSSGKPPSRAPRGKLDASVRL